MKRMAFVWLGATALACTGQAFAVAQTPVNQASNPSAAVPGDCARVTAKHCQNSCEGEAECCPTGHDEVNERILHWIVQMRPAVRREVMSNLLIGIHPLMAFVPTEGIAELPGDHPVPACARCRVVSIVVREMEPEEPSEESEPSDGAAVYLGPCAPFELEMVADDSNSVNCPFLVEQRLPKFTACNVPADVLANLQLLLQADDLLRRGQQLSRDGHLVEAVDCFQEVHRLVPGTNLEVRAGEETQNILVRIYGTTTQPGLVDEQSEPEKCALPPDTPARQHGVGECECSEFATEHRESAVPAPVPASSPGKMRTIVYPVGDLLGRGKETRHDDLDDLTTVIVNTVEPQTWTDNQGEGTIEYFYRSRALVIRQSTEVHAQIAELLDSLRQAKDVSDSREERPHHTLPVEGQAAKVYVEPSDSCSCCSEKPHTANTHLAEIEDCAGEECCPVPVFTLSATAANADCEECDELELFVEGCTGAMIADCFHCASGGACTELTPGADGLRFRCQIPVGPVLFLVKYEQRTLTLGVGMEAGNESADEECHVPD